MRTPTTPDQIGDLISQMAEVIQNLETAREQLADSRLDSALIHLGTFHVLSERLIASSQRMCADVESQVNSFNLGASSSHKRSMEKYKKYASHLHKPKKRPENE